MNGEGSGESERFLLSPFTASPAENLTRVPTSYVTTLEDWVAFRRWIETTQHGVFRIIGTLDQSWDWPHIEYVGQLPGFGSVEELLATARRCDSTGAADCAEAR